MTEEETRARLVDVENQMTQIVAMMAKMRLLFLHPVDNILLLQMWELQTQSKHRLKT